MFKTSTEEMEKVKSDLKSFESRLAQKEMMLIGLKIGISWRTIDRYIREGKVAKLETALEIKTAVRKYISKRDKKILTNVE